MDSLFCPFWELIHAYTFEFALASFDEFWRHLQSSMKENWIRLLTQGNIFSFFISLEPADIGRKLKVQWSMYFWDTVFSGSLEKTVPYVNWGSPLSTWWGHLRKILGNMSTVQRRPCHISKFCQTGNAKNTFMGVSLIECREELWVDRPPECRSMWINFRWIRIIES